MISKCLGECNLFTSILLTSWKEKEKNQYHSYIENFFFYHSILHSSCDFFKDNIVLYMGPDFSSNIYETFLINK